MPFVCPEGQRCPVEVHVDHDPGPGIKDFACGKVTYNGHSGIDFRVEDLLAVAQGVPVVAAAAGTVETVQDDIRDHSPFDYDQAEAASSSVCGNRVVISHGPEWSTHYCHLRQGPSPVQVGQEVKAGDLLGYVGMSGSTNFPHFQFNLLHTPPGKRLDIDPFAPEGFDEVCSADISASAWSPRAQRQLAYVSPAIANLGFAAGAVTNRGIENGTYKSTLPGADSDAMVFYARAIGLEAGDVQRLTILAPDGTVLVEETTDPLAKPRLQSFIFAGRRLRAERWPAGTYIGFYEVLRNGRVVLSAEDDLKIP
ncbi:MAG: M23 family metallopeptidase [Kiloniellales bacterium]